MMLARSSRHQLPHSRIAPSSGVKVRCPRLPTRVQAGPSSRDPSEPVVIVTGSTGQNASPQDFWAQKPAWCQPWSILLTGVSASAGSWALLHKWWITAPVSVGVAVWWWLFLVLVPQSYASYMAEESSSNTSKGQ